MAATAHIGNGIKVAYATGSPHTWKKLESVTEVVIPKLTPEMLDSTVSGTSPYKREYPGMLSVSALEVMMIRDNSSATSPNQNSLFGYIAGDTLYWRIEIPTTSAQTSFEAYTFQGRVASFEPEAPVKGTQMVKATITFDGEFFQRQEPHASVIG